MQSLMVQAGVHDEAEYLLRHQMFEDLLKEEKFFEAANCLGKLNLDAVGGGKVRPTRSNVTVISISWVD